MVRDKKTGKTKGYAFICYEDQRSTILAVDNFNTSKILQRTIRVDHVKDYRPPDQDDKNVDDVTKMVRAEGVAPRALTPDSENEGYLLPLSDKEHKKKNKAKKSKKEKKVKREKADVVIKEEPRHANQILNADVKETRRRPEEIRGRESDKYANARSCDDREQRRVADDRSDRPVPTRETKEERGRWKSGHDMEPLKSHRRRRSPDARVEGKRDDLSQHTSARRRSRSPVNWHSHRRSRSRDRKQRRRSRSIERHKYGE
ncbi:RNA-binding motif protein, X-linked 2-like isoform X2 [Watersipora subatra]